MPGIEFVASFNHDPFVKSANAILSSFRNMSAQVERMGGNMQHVMDGIFDGTNLGRGMQSFFDGIIENFGLSEKAAESFRKRAEVAIRSIANGSEDAATKISHITTSLAQIVSELKQADMSVLSDNGSGSRSLEDLRISTAFLIDELNSATEAADNLQEKIKSNKGAGIEEKISDIKNYENALLEASQTADKAYSSQEEYIKGIQTELATLTDKIKKSDDQSNISQWTTEAEELTRRLTDAENVLSQIKSVKDNINFKIESLENVKETVSAFDDLNKKLQTYGNIVGQVEFGTKEADKAFQDYANHTKSASDEIKGSLQKIAAVAGIAFGINEAVGFVRQVEETRTYFQDIESSMKVFLGSEEKAMEFTQKLKDYAWYNMFEFSDLAKASQQMIAYGQDVDIIIPKLDMLSNIAAGTHAPLMEMVDAYNRAKSTGVVDGMAVKSWATKGVVIKDVLREMGEQASGTSISFEQLNKVLEHLTGEGGMFHNLMQEQLNDISAEKGQLEDNLASMYNEIGEKLQGAITKWYKLQSDMVDNYSEIAGGDGNIDFVVNFAENGMDFLMENWKSLIKLIKDATIVYGSWRVAIAMSNAARVAHLEWLKAEATAININNGHIVSNTIVRGQATRATVLWDKAMKAFNATMLASPWTWAAAAITGFIYAAYSYYDNILTSEKAQSSLNSALETYNEILDEAQAADMENIKVIKDHTASLYEQYRAYEELIKARAIFAQYSKEEIAQMTPEQLKTILTQEDAQKQEKYLRSQIEALKEYQQIVSKVGFLDFSFNVPEAEQKFKDTFAKFEIPEDIANSLWEKVGWNTKLGDFTAQLIATTGEQLRQEIEDKTNAGIKGGLERGISDASIKSQIQSLINSFVNEIDGKTIEGGQKVAENYKSQLQPVIKELSEKFTELNREYISTTGQKKIDIKTELDATSETIEYLNGVMSFFDAAVVNKELRVSIQNTVEGDYLGADYVKSLGEEYSKIDNLTSKYIINIEKAREESERLGLTAEASAIDIATQYGLTAESVESDFVKAKDEISRKIDELNDDYKNAKTEIEKEKIKIKIAEYEKLIQHIQNIQDKVYNIVKDPRNLVINIVPKIAKDALNWLKGTLGIGDLPSAFEDGGDAKANFNAGYASGAASRKAQANAETIKEDEKTPPIVKSSAEWRKTLRQNLTAAQKELDDFNKGQGEYKGKQYNQTDYDKTKTKLENAVKAAKNALGGDPSKAEKKRAKEAATRQAKALQEEWKHQEQMTDLQQKAVRAREDALIAAEQNAAVRGRKQQEIEYQRKIEDLKDQEDEIYKTIYEQRKKQWELEHKDSPYENTDEGKRGYLSVDAQSAMRASMTKKEQDMWDAQVAIRKELRDYLKEYGSLHQQREAITAEYDQKISDERDAIQRAALERQKERLLSELDMKELQQSIDWESVFGNLDRYAVSALRDLKSKLRKALDAKDITVENAQILAEKINEIEENTAKRTDVWASILPGLRERKKLTEQAANAEKVYQKALEEEADAINKVIADKQAIKEQLDKLDIRNALGEKITIELEAISEENKERLLSSLDKDSDLYKQLLEMFKNLATDTANAGAASETTTQKRNLKNSLDKALDKGGIKQFASDLFNFEGMGFTEIAGLVNQNVQSMSGFVDKIGLGETEFGKAVHNFADGVGGFSNAIQSLASGDVFGALNGVIDGIVGFGGTLGSIFGFGGADYSGYEEVKGRYEQLSSVWDELIDKKREYLSESWSSEASEAYDEIMEMISTERDMAKAVGKEFLDSGASTGSHSQNYRHWENDGWKGRASAIRQGLISAGLGDVGQITGMYSFLDMSSEQLEWIKRNNAELWAVMSDGIKGPLEDIIAFGETEKEVLEDYRKQLTTTTEDDVFSDFMNRLYDIADGSEDVFDEISDNWQKMVNKMVVNNLIGANFQSQLKGWYEKLAKANEDLTKGVITEKEYQKILNDLKNEYEEDVRNAKGEIDQLREMGIIQSTGENATADKKATYSVADKVTYDQMDEFTGILRATQIAVEHGGTTRDLILENLQTLANFSIQGNQDIRELRNLQMIANDYLLDIRKSNRSILDSFGEKMDRIIDRIDDLDI